MHAEAKLHVSTHTDVGTNPERGESLAELSSGVSAEVIEKPDLGMRFTDRRADETHIGNDTMNFKICTVSYCYDHFPALV